MSKRKTVLKFSIAALLLGGSSTVAVLYFPYVALAIKFGIVISTAPLAIFAISVVAALVSVITLAAFTISAIRSKGKSNKVSSEPRSKNEEEGESLVQEKEQAVPILTPPLLSQEPEKSVIPIPQQPPVDDPVKETETPQPDVMVNGADQQANQTEESLPPYPEPTSPLNSMDQLKSFPELPSIVSLEGSSNSIKNCKEREYVLFLPSLSEQPLTLSNAKLAFKLRAALDEYKRQQPNQASTENSYVSWGSDFEDSIIGNNSLPSVSITQELEERSGGVRCFSELNNVHNILEYRRQLSLMNNCSNSYCSSMLSSIQEPDRLQASLGSDNPSVQSFQPKKELLYDVNKKIFDSVDYEVNYTRLSENAGEAPNYEREFPLTETNVNSGPEAMPYDVNENGAPYSSIQSPVPPSSASRSNSFS
ncbi:hypothetical protein [Wolbachia endosymbiont (group B) of Sphaerophoria taeniata]|uniref:hypothetical protein n=1 Tax=Wolbachia endosymbiont (group B) of Sphaerophoria taeniata TaxID=2954058 RepID=UPI00221F1C75|nr:hypothetical protein [Wolbachia endosymbiont (group B) of Sphaerophoria taeniata]